MRLFTVRIRVDDDPNRQYTVLAIQPDGRFLLADTDGNFQQLRPGECMLGSHYLSQDEREWWRSLSAPPADHVHE